MCDLNLNLLFSNGHRSDSVSDQHFILLRSPGQINAFLGSDESNSVTATLASWAAALWPHASKGAVLSSVRQMRRSRSCWDLTNSRQSQQKAVVFKQLMALCVVPSGTHPLDLHWFMSPLTAVHCIHCGSVIAKGNLQCNPNLSIEAPSSQRSVLAFNTALHSRHSWLEKNK